MGKDTNWWMIVAIVAILLLLFSGSGMMGFGRGFGGCGLGSNYSRYGSMMSWMFSNPFGWIFGFVAMLLLWGFAIVILVYFIKMITQSTKSESLYSKRKTQ